MKTETEEDDEQTENWRGGAGAQKDLQNRNLPDPDNPNRIQHVGYVRMKIYN